MKLINKIRSNTPINGCAKHIIANIIPNINNNIINDAQIKVFKSNFILILY